jgi:tetratricopeptide (TPR) repeat protein
VLLSSPSWEKQDWNNCGPATLSLYLKTFGWGGDQFEISDLLKPERGDKNVNVEELVFYVRNNAGWLNADFRVGGDLDILKQFIASGLPIMIEKGYYGETVYYPNDDRWLGHYLLLTGYDDARQVFIAQDTFLGPDREVSYDVLDEGWRTFNRVYIYLYLPAQENLVNEILGPHQDPDYNRQHALDAAEAEVEGNPEDAYAWFNLGSNLVYFERYAEAAEAFDTARTIGLPQRMFRYQFGPFFAYFHSGRNDELLTITEYALRITDNSEETLLWRGWALYRDGDVTGAVELFRTALEENPYYIDAQYALDFIQGN